MHITPAQCRAARALLNWSPERLALAAQHAAETVALYETGTTSTDTEVADALQRALETGGIRFIDADQTSAAGGVGVRLLTSAVEFDTDTSETVQYKEHLAPDAPTGAGG